MSPDPWLHSPAALLAQWRDEPGSDRLSAYEAFWRDRGRAISDTIDRMGTPPLVMYDRWGERVDTIAMPSGYQDLLERGYREGVVASPHASGSLRWSYALGFVTAFCDPGLYCPYTVSLGTTLALTKFGAGESRDTLLARLTRTDGMPWQGATWMMTEAGGGSDLGANVATVAEPEGSSWALPGSKYFARDVGAEVAVVAARRRDAPGGPRGVGLYAVPRRDDAGELNYRIRRLKDKIATRSVPTGEVELDRASAVELAGPGEGIYPIMEILNVSRVANSVGSVALIQRALSEAVTFAGPADTRSAGPSPTSPCSGARSSNGGNAWPKRSPSRGPRRTSSTRSGSSAAPTRSATRASGCSRISPSIGPPSKRSRPVAGPWRRSAATGRWPTSASSDCFGKR
jgi:hypothetical protein